MKSTTTKLMVTAAAMLMAGLASAQTVTAEIPFAFRANGAVLQAGTYRLKTSDSSGTHIVYMQSQRSLKSIMIVPQTSLDSRRWGSDPKLVFRCEGENCALTQIWSGGALGFQLHYPKSSGHEEATFRFVTLRAERAD
jgi:hypothetical protein